MESRMSLLNSKPKRCPFSQNYGIRSHEFNKSRHLAMDFFLILKSNKSFVIHVNISYGLESEAMNAFYVQSSDF